MNASIASTANNAVTANSRPLMASGISEPSSAPASTLVVQLAWSRPWMAVIRVEE
ncbi:hypothetical protein ACLQ8T_06510 [Glutamicibacter sp. FR1]|uniref:hypothetical protein n=1 Tax=Glutamicibacter sp. FR1 TaxID=3393744 RepID=UPI0039AE9EA9